jgi:hypothetical protein
MRRAEARRQGRSPAPQLDGMTWRCGRARLFRSVFAKRRIAITPEDSIDAALIVTTCSSRGENPAGVSWMALGTLMAEPTRG